MTAKEICAATCRCGVTRRAARGSTRRRRAGSAGGGGIGSRTPRRTRSPTGGAGRPSRCPGRLRRAPLAERAYQSARETSAGPGSARPVTRTWRPSSRQYRCAARCGLAARSTPHRGVRRGREPEALGREVLEDEGAARRRTVRVDGRPGCHVRLEELGVDRVDEPARRQLQRVVGRRIRVERGQVRGEHRERAEPFPPGGGGGARGRREGPIHAANLVPHCAPVAQWIERFPPEEEVARSSRVGGTVEGDRRALSASLSKTASRERSVSGRFSRLLPVVTAGAPSIGAPVAARRAPASHWAASPSDVARSRYVRLLDALALQREWAGCRRAPTCGRHVGAVKCGGHVGVVRSAAGRWA